MGRDGVGWRLGPVGIDWWKVLVGVSWQLEEFGACIWLEEVVGVGRALVISRLGGGWLELTG